MCLLEIMIFFVLIVEEFIILKEWLVNIIIYLEKEL